MKKTSPKTESRVIDATPEPKEPALTELVRREIQVKDWTLTQIDEEKEPRIFDLELAARLGFAQQYDIRKLIKRMASSGQLEGIVATVAKNTGKRGRPSESYYLTKAQALKVIARSETPTADKILDEVIAVYIAYQEGQLPPVAQIQPRQESKQIAELTASVAQLVGVVGQLVSLSMNSMAQPAAPQPQQPEALDPGFPTRQTNPQRALALVKPKAPAIDTNADPAWHWLAKVAARLRLSFDQALRIVQIHGIPSRWAVTTAGNKATQITDEGFREVERHARAMGLI
jgi:hypothetical protein